LEDYVVCATFSFGHSNVRHYVKKRGLKIKTVPTDNNPTDLLTKHLGETMFNKFRDALGIKNVKTALAEA
jgi:hypothetical protein